MTKSKSGASIEQLSEIARWVLAERSSDIILLKGEMGAGKTTLIKAMCKELQVEDEVSSPTYSLVNEYYSPTHGTVYHFDFYRLEHESEAQDMGIEEYLYSGNLCLIEWPEKIRNLLPDDCDTVRITVSGNQRTFELNTNSHE